MNNTTSVMMTTYNRLDLTKRMIESFLKTTKSFFRFIVVDNGSVDDTPFWLHNDLNKMMRSNYYCQSYDVYLNHDNKGIASGRNQGLKIANKYKDPYLCCIDNDAEMPDNWLAKCIDFLQANPKFSIGVNMEDVNYPLMEKNGKMCQYKKDGNLGSACMVFPRHLHSLIGYFSTEMNKFYGEDDANWGFRARIAKYELAYLPENGIHFGVGELDSGAYREFKDNCRKENIQKFRQDCMDYMRGVRSIYYQFKVRD